MAARVLSAIRAGELYLFTHPEIRVAAEERFAAILAAMDKAGAGSEPTELALDCTGT